jgi:hypothetical protein
MQPNIVNAEAQVVNQQRLVAIELQREKVREPDRRVQQRKLDEAARQAELERETFGVSSSVNKSGLLKSYSFPEWRRIWQKSQHTLIKDTVGQRLL